MPALTRLFQKLKQLKSPKLIAVVEAAHTQAFEEIDCMTCANCCKTISPRFNATDIDRIAKYERLKSSEFIDKYLTQDQDGDFVTTVRPCPFLQEDNACRIYDIRPKDCRGYPHTDSPNFAAMERYHTKNADVCPATVRVLALLQLEMRK
jgi:uncharacterized protein